MAGRTCANRARRLTPASCQCHRPRPRRGSRTPRSACACTPSPRRGTRAERTPSAHATQQSARTTPSHSPRLRTRGRAIRRATTAAEGPDRCGVVAREWPTSGLWPQAPRASATKSARALGRRRTSATPLRSKRLDDSVVLNRLDDSAERLEPRIVVHHELDKARLWRHHRPLLPNQPVTAAGSDPFRYTRRPHWSGGLSKPLLGILGLVAGNVAQTFFTSGPAAAFNFEQVRTDYIPQFAASHPFVSWPLLTLSELAAIYGLILNRKIRRRQDSLDKQVTQGPAPIYVWTRRDTVLAGVSPSPP